MVWDHGVAGSNPVLPTTLNKAAKEIWWLCCFYEVQFMFTVYILFSKGLQKYYTGQTQNMENRLREHNSGETKFIRSGKPWELICTKNVETRSEAIRLEKKIKIYGAKRYLSQNK